MPGVLDKEMRTGHPWHGTLHGTKAHVKRIPARIYHEDSTIKDQRVKSRLLARVLDPVALASCRRSCCSLLAASETDNRDAGATNGLRYAAELGFRPARSCCDEGSG